MPEPTDQDGPAGSAPTTETTVPGRAAPEVRIAQGVVRGRWRPGSAAFLGIPFADAPVGHHRFAAPVPAAGWDGVRECTEYGPTAQRRGFPDAAIVEPSIIGDAVLNVNVFTPVPGEADARLPVLVYIHGGGYKGGSPASPWYDGFAFNRDGVVTVTISYRLGFDGFGWIPDAPHNRGLLDQIAALEWVRDNVGAFGGDPGCVTIAGQSAGGGSVWALLVSPRARGLFHAAISQSGALSPQPAEVARANGARLARLAGVDWRRAALAELPEDRVLDLQEQVEAELADDEALDAGQVGGEQGGADLAGQDAALAGAVAAVVAGRTASLAYTPYVDGEVLVGSVPEALRDGVAAGVPVLAGATAHEFTQSGLALGLDAADEADVAAALAATPLAPVAEEYAATYADLPGGAGAVVGQLTTDTTFRVPLARWAELRATAPTWLYDFRLTHPGTGLAAHCAEGPFVWDNLEAERVAHTSGPNPPPALADAMHTAWVTFVREHRAPWAPWHEGREAMVYDAESHPGPAYGLERRMAELLPEG